MSGYYLTNAARQAEDALEQARRAVTKLWCEIARDHHDRARGPSSKHEDALLIDGLSQALKAHAKTLSALRELYFHREREAEIARRAVMGSIAEVQPERVESDPVTKTTHRHPSFAGIVGEPRVL